MKLWCLPLSLIMGMAIGHFQAKTIANPEVSTNTAHPKDRTPAPLLPARRGKGDQEISQIPKQVLAAIQFEKLVDGQVTPVAKHILGLTPEQGTAVDTILAERSAALASYKKRMEMAAFLVDKQEDALVVEIPSDPDAVLQIEKDCWDDLVSTLGKARTQFLIGAIRVQNSTHTQKDILTFQNDGRYHRLQYTEHEGRRYSPTHTEAQQESLPSHWDTVLLGLAEE